MGALAAVGVVAAVGGVAPFTCNFSIRVGVAVGGSCCAFLSGGTCCAPVIITMNYINTELFKYPVNAFLSIKDFDFDLRKSR